MVSHHPFVTMHSFLSLLKEYCICLPGRHNLSKKGIRLHCVYNILMVKNLVGKGLALY